jgi:hypothetical protein
MRICYLDESGTAELPGSTSHFVLLGVSIPGETWKAKDAQITQIKRRFGLEREEIHTGWLARRFIEQERIPDFENLGIAARRAAVQHARDAFLIQKAARRGPASVQADRKNFAKTAPYTHLTMAERRDLLRQVATAVSSWDDCKIIAECTDKRTFGPLAPLIPPFEEAFTQVVTRFHRGLEEAQPTEEHGLLVQDNNAAMGRRLTELMRVFHERGTRWLELRLIVETPLFVDSSLTSMVQVADVCAYATRRFCENNEVELFDIIYPRVQRANGRLVGMRHYTNRASTYGRRCPCRICVEH